MRWRCNFNQWKYEYKIIKIYKLILRKHIIIRYRISLERLKKYHYKIWQDGAPCKWYIRLPTAIQSCVELLAIVLYVLLRFTDSYYRFGAFKLFFFLLRNYSIFIHRHTWYKFTILLLKGKQNYILVLDYCMFLYKLLMQRYYLSISYH